MDLLYKIVWKTWGFLLASKHQSKCVKLRNRIFAEKRFVIWRKSASSFLLQEPETHTFPQIQQQLSVQPRLKIMSTGYIQMILKSIKMPKNMITYHTWTCYMKVLVSWTRPRLHRVWIM